MRSRDLETLGYIGIVIGAILIVGGLFAYAYEERVWYYMVAYPYRQTGILLFLLGGILLALGIIILIRSHNDVKSENGSH